VKSTSENSNAPAKHCSRSNAFENVTCARSVLVRAPVKRRASTCSICRSANKTTQYALASAAATKRGGSKMRSCASARANEGAAGIASMATKIITAIRSCDVTVSKAGVTESSEIPAVTGVAAAADNSAVITLFVKETHVIAVAFTSVAAMAASWAANESKNPSTVAASECSKAQRGTMIRTSSTAKRELVEREFDLALELVFVLALSGENG